MKKNKRTLTPKLRFPEFREQWDEVRLSHLAKLISDRVGTLACIPYTVTSGLGLVSQEEKYGRTIAGNSLRNYIRLQKDDFAYNKSATKAYPEGYIARYLDEAKAAVPNSIFTCFRVDPEKIIPAYLDFLFAANLHGRWLRKFLTIGARAHGSLNVSDDDLMALPVPLPSLPEQQKIAECLSSLDGLIAAEGRMLEAMRGHKRGLMQQLFPLPGETHPALRFPEFQNARSEFRPIGSFAKVTTGNKDTQNKVDDGEYPFFVRSQNVERIDSFSQDCEAVLTSGDGVGVGENYHYINGKFDFHQRVYCIYDFIPSVSGQFFFHYFSTHFKKRVKEMSAKNSVDSVRMAMITEMPIWMPPPAEQRRIAHCLTALNDRIAEQVAKIDALKAHKRGLMQQLFPASEEQ